MTTITLPPRKPDWLRHQLSMLEQREEMIRDVIRHLQALLAQQPSDTPPAVILALDQANTDQHEVQQHIAVLTTGWDTLHPKP